MSVVVEQLVNTITKLQKLHELCVPGPCLNDFLEKTVDANTAHENYYWRNKLESHSYVDHAGATRLNIYTLMCSLDLYSQRRVFRQVNVSTEEQTQFMDYMSSIYTWFSPFHLGSCWSNPITLDANEKQQIEQAWDSSVPANDNFLARDHTMFFMKLSTRCQEAVLCFVVLNRRR